MMMWKLRRARQTAQRLLLIPLVAVSLVEMVHAADDIVAKLGGEPRRNVVPQARPVDVVAREVVPYEPTASGAYPVMIFPTNALVVEAVFPLMKSPGNCRSILADYDKRLRAQYGSSKIRHRLYCLLFDNGKLKSINTVATSF
jgi:hypothetical protein